MVRRLLYLNGLSIGGVILFHATGLGFTAMFAWAHRYLPAGATPADQVGGPAYLALRVIEQLVVFGLPALLVVSGYFLAVASGKGDQTLGWKTVWARLKTLLLPYLVWTAIILVLEILENRQIPTPRRLFLDVFTGSSNDVMYFIPLLVQYYLLAPLLVWSAKQNWKALLIFSALVQLGVTLLAYPLYLGAAQDGLVGLYGLVPRWLFPARLLWIVLGIVLGLHLEQFKRFFQRWRWFCLAVAVILLPLGILEWELFFRLSGEQWLAHRETILDHLYSLALIFSFLGFTDTRLPLVKSFERLGAVTYAIFLTHFIFIVYTARVIYHLAPQLLAYQVVLQPVLIGAGLIGPLALIMLFERTPLRRYYKIVLG